MKVLLCGIAKCENNYIKEWIDWYKKIGIDHICLYDNNDINGEKFEDVISDDIKSGFVEIINYKGKVDCQLEAYTECYKKYGKSYDWLLFLDIDELLDIEHGDIKDFLSDKRYMDFNGIRVQWKVFDDNGLVRVKNGDYNMYNRFTHPAEEHSDNYQTKVIVRGKQDGIVYTDSPHYPNNLTSVCNTLGEEVKLEDWLPKQDLHKVAVINHYRCKTIQEYVENKMQRLWANQSKDWARSILTIDYFFRRNKRTKEKEQCAKEILDRIQRKVTKSWHVKNNVDILYIVGTGSKWVDNELRYSLRSIAKNGYNVGRVFIVGNIPGFVNRNNVICIPLDDPYNAKHQNILYKIDYVINHTDIGSKNDGKFLISSDDHFYVRPTNFDEYPFCYTGELPEKERVLKEKGFRDWWNSMIATRKALAELDMPCLKFNWHGNTWFNSILWKDKKFQELIKESFDCQYGFEPTALMLNYWMSVAKFTPELKKDCKLDGFCSKEKFNRIIASREVFSCYSNIRNSYIASWLKAKFPSKCKYEI